MSLTKAESQALQTGAKACDDGAQEITNMMAALMQQLEVLDTSWQGQAGSTFMQVKQSIDGHTKKIAANLMEVANGIRTTDHSFGSEDADAGAMVSNAGAIADGLR